MGYFMEDIVDYDDLGVFDASDDSESLSHYGMPRRSGRYPWGSGKENYQHSGDFLSRVETLRKDGFTFTDSNGKTWTGDTAIAKYFDMPTTSFRTQVSMARAERRGYEVAKAKALLADGKNPTQIAQIMGYKHESSIRSLLNSETEARMKQARATADFLKKMVDEKGMIDVGAGVERELGVSKEKLKEALAILEVEGYPNHGGRIPQVTDPDRKTTLKVLCPPGTEHREIFDHYDQIKSVVDYGSTDGGDTFQKKGFVYPESLSSKRVMIRYAEDGGIDKDGVVELRRGVPDLDLGGSNYAQVRIMVDGTHYIKGMAVYADDLPDGIDVRFNTNKSSNVPMTAGKGEKSVLKEIKTEPGVKEGNPFGAVVKQGGQYYYTGKDGKQHLSPLNKTREEGEWNEWARNLPSQFLSKQTRQLARQQLGLDIYDRQSEFEDICALTNPTVKRAFLQDFADGCDSASVHLKAAALPRQKFQVILPLNSIKDNEVYAPNFEQGEQVALVRYPHGGTFEIPILTVNNRNREGKGMIGTAPLDAVGINHKVADRLSGADFDGDTVMVIPTNDRIRISSQPPLKGLEGFDPKLQYGGKEPGTFKPMKNTQNEMGRISNLITDMTIIGATQEELAAAVRHSMVVIDAEKHKLDYKQSEIDNNIAALKRKYQGETDADGRTTSGSATLISRAKSPTHIDKRVGSPKINIKGKPWYDPTRPEGALLYKTVHEQYVGKDGKVHTRTIESTRMADTDDATTLISKYDTPMERIYADYANKMKSLANSARKELVATGSLHYDPEARKEYSHEATTLENKLARAERNAPRERQAQIMANSIVQAKKRDNPELLTEKGKGDLKKIRQQALEDSRSRVGAQRYRIEISEREWEAIQKGAISDTKLASILKYADTDKLRDWAMPRNRTELSPYKVQKLSTLKENGYSTAEIAKSLGVSTSTVLKYMGKA